MPLSVAQTDAAPSGGAVVSCCVCAMTTKRAGPTSGAISGCKSKAGGVDLLEASVAPSFQNVHKFKGPQAQGLKAAALLCQSFS